MNRGKKRRWEKHQIEKLIILIIFCYITACPKLSDFCLWIGNLGSVGLGQLIYALLGISWSSWTTGTGIIWMLPHMYGDGCWWPAGISFGLWLEYLHMTFLCVYLAPMQHSGCVPAATVWERTRWKLYCPFYPSLESHAVYYKKSLRLTHN